MMKWNEIEICVLFNCRRQETDKKKKKMLFQFLTFILKVYAQAGSLRERDYFLVWTKFLF